MRLHKAWPQHPEIGSFALRMLWIPIVASVLVVGFLALRTPQDDRAPTMAVATAKELATVADTAPASDTTARYFTASASDATARNVEAAAAQPDESIARHEALDPVGAGTAR